MEQHHTILIFIPPCAFVNMIQLCFALFCFGHLVDVSDPLSEVEVGRLLVVHTLMDQSINPSVGQTQSEENPNSHMQQHKSAVREFDARRNTLDKTVIRSAYCCTTISFREPLLLLILCTYVLHTCGAIQLSLGKRGASQGSNNWWRATR